MKKKIFIAALAICLVVVSIAGSSLAYFTDTKQYTNVFTAGDGVALKIYVADSEYTQSGLTPEVDVYPGQVTNQKVELQSTGSSAYVGAIITFTKPSDPTDPTDLGYIINKDGTDNANYKTAAVESLLKSLDTSNNDVIVSDDGLTVYVIQKAAAVKDAKIKLFDGVSVPTDWGNDEIAKFNGVNMSVVGYAVQTAGFDDNDAATTDDAIKAFKAAFPTEFAAVGN